jgi:hypothetical protein
MDILDQLDHLLLNTPTDALATVPLKRKFVVAAAKEIRRLRSLEAASVTAAAADVDAQTRTSLDPNE